ncbi:MAG: hypothetical protein J0I14_04315 [Propionibacteriaceae bacterium]|jgi:hypothetical protein|nr:hypothetical protein [Propionibacteriaceae bacterium]
MSAWVDQFFDADQARTGGVIRRSVYDIREHRGALDEIIDRAKEEDFHVIETGDQIVVLCHSGALTIYC